MADFSALKTSIQNYIKQNGNEEITGNLLQQILLSMVTTLGDSAINDLVTALNTEIANRGNADTELSGRITTLQGVVNGIKANVENGYVYAGIATPSTTPVSGKVFYLALTAGTYTNFGATVVPQGINILKYNGSAWSLDSFLGLDDAPTQGSGHLVKSGGAYNSISAISYKPLKFEHGMLDINGNFGYHADRIVTKDFYYVGNVESVTFKNISNQYLVIVCLYSDAKEGTLISRTEYASSTITIPSTAKFMRVFYMRSGETLDPDYPERYYTVSPICNNFNIDILKSEIKEASDTQLINFTKKGEFIFENGMYEGNTGGKAIFDGRIRTVSKIKFKVGEKIRIIPSIGISVVCYEYENEFDSSFVGRSSAFASQTDYVIAYPYIAFVVLSSDITLTPNSPSNYVRFIYLNDIDMPIPMMTSAPKFYKNKAIYSGVLTDGEYNVSEICYLEKSTMYLNIADGYRVGVFFYKQPNDDIFISSTPWLTSSQSVTLLSPYFRIQVGKISQTAEMDIPAENILSISEFNDFYKDGHFVSGGIQNNGVAGNPNDNRRKSDLKFYKLQDNISQVSISCKGYPVIAYFYSDKRDDTFLFRTGYLYEDSNIVDLTDYSTAKYIRFVVCCDVLLSADGVIFEDVDDVISITPSVLNGTLIAKNIKSRACESFCSISERKACVCIMNDLTDNGDSSTISPQCKMLNILNNHNIKIGFNVVIEKFIAYGVMRRFCERLIMLGHDVNLHSNPSYSGYNDPTLLTQYIENSLSTLNSYGIYPDGWVTNGVGIPPVAINVGKKYFKWIQSVANSPLGQNVYYNDVTGSPLYIQRAGCDHVNNSEQHPSDETIEGAFSDTVLNNRLLVMYAHGYKSGNGGLEWDEDALAKVISEIEAYKAKNEIFNANASNTISYYYTVRWEDFRNI